MTNAQPGGVPAVQPDSDIRVPVLRQAWRTVTFVHWRCDTALLQQRLPAGLTVEEYDGSAWLTLTLLRMHGVRLPGTPAVPGLSDFPETNLRTYVRGPGGRQGLWFFSLDAASAWITAGARLLLGAPYFLAELDIEVGDAIRYTGTRAGRVPAVYRLEIRPGPPIDAAGLHLWLTHRWRAYTWHAGCLLEIPVRHEPWPLRTATAATLMESLTTAACLPAPTGAPLIHYSDGVERVAFGPAAPPRTRRRPPLPRRPVRPGWRWARSTPRG